MFKLSIYNLLVFVVVYIYDLFVLQVCLMHFILVILATISLVFNSRIQSIIVYIISVYVSILLLTKMIYQIEYIREDTWNVTCPVCFFFITSCIHLFVILLHIN